MVMEIVGKNFLKIILGLSTNKINYFFTVVYYSLSKVIPTFAETRWY